MREEATPIAIGFGFGFMRIETHRQWGMIRKMTSKNSSQTKAFTILESLIVLCILFVLTMVLVALFLHHQEGDTVGETTTPITGNTESSFELEIPEPVSPENLDGEPALETIEPVSAEDLANQPVAEESEAISRFNPLDESASESAEQVPPTNPAFRLKSSKKSSD